ncbi:MAG: hypothetical protein NC338_03335, partial [Firmicutes bacterium]|nr:hypothetical protein [Bacillota bacterium]MCM1401844.1 hypothetical protein [Bacteroides sp.]MCM1477729.1 hypothetical protein [Bacteroides sp.]
CSMIVRPSFNIPYRMDSKMANDWTICELTVNDRFRAAMNFTTFNTKITIPQKKTNFYLLIKKKVVPL